MKKQSKYAILTGAAEYLQNLQKQSEQLCNDFGKLAQDHHELGTYPLLPSSSDGNNDRLRCMEVEQLVEKERLSFFLKGEDAALQAQKTFYTAPMPMAIVGIDGNFLEINAMFVKVSRMSMEYLQQISLFKLIQPSCLHDCYTKIAEMMLPGTMMLPSSPSSSYIHSIHPNSHFLRFMLFLITVRMSMDGAKLCRPHHTHQNNVCFDRPMGRSGCSRLSLPGDRLLVR